MIKINLLDEVKAAGERPTGPSEGKAAIDPDQQKKNIIFGVEVGVALVIIAIWYFTLNGKYTTLLSQKTEKENEYRKVQALLEEVEKYRAQKALLQKQVDLIEELKVKQKGPADLMKRLYTILPDQVFLKKLEQKDTAVKLIGEALNDPALSNFYNKLDGSAYFVDIVPGKKIKTNKSINFDLACRFVIDPTKEAPAAQGKKRRPGAGKPPGSK